MAITSDSIKAFTAKVKTLTKDQAKKFLEDNKDKIKGNPELQKAVTSAYAEAFTNVPTPTSSLNISNKSSAPTTTAQAISRANAIGQKNGVGAAPVVPPVDNTIKVPGATIPQTGEIPRKSVTIVEDIDNKNGTRSIRYSDGTSGVVRETKNPDGSSKYSDITASDASGTVTNSASLTLPSYSYKGSELGTGKDVSFTPTRLAASGFAINDNGTTDQEKLGLTDAQQADLLGYGKALKKSNTAVVQQTALIANLIKKYQENNKDVKTYGITYGTKPEGIPTDPTTSQKSVGSMIDMNNNGIPDSQEGYGVDTLNQTPLKDVNLTESVVNVPNIDTSNLTGLESTALEYAKAMADYEAVTKTSAAEAEAGVTSAAAKRIIDTNNEYIGAVTGLLEERLSQNRQQYLDVVGETYQAAGGQVKAIQRVIGSDGVVMDDITALALIGEQGQAAMQKVIDLKNDLVNSYLKQKQEAIDAIYALRDDNALTQNEADEAINAIRSRAKSGVIDITKNYYKEVFGITEGADIRAKNTTSNTRAAVSGYLAAIGMSPLQQTQLINNYVKDGYSTEEALAKLAEDIRDKKNPVIAWAEENNADAAAAAWAEFDRDMALEIEPILAKGQIDLDLQNDKQAFEAEQASLDRALRRAGLISQSSSSGGAKLAQSSWDKGFAAFQSAKEVSDGVSGLFPEQLTQDEFRALTNSIANPKNQRSQEILQQYGITAKPDNKYAEALVKSKID